MIDKLGILSLLPAATEVVYLLGLEKYLVGVSHECDYPLEAKLLPKVTSSPVSNNLSSKEINDAVSKLKHKGSGVFHINQKLLAKFKPNLILTQELCDVCAISWTQVQKASKVLEGDVKIISLEPESINDILENILLIGEISHKRQESRKLVKSLKQRLRNIESILPRHFKNSEVHWTSSPRNDGKRVLIIEWLDPIMIAGHWVPEMIEKAGGIAVETKVGQKSFPISIDQIVKAKPDIVVFAPCGFDITRTLSEKPLIEKIFYNLKHTTCKLFLMDGNAYLTRPGPRIIDGVEILTEVLHPEIFPKKHSSLDWLILPI